MPFAFFAAYPYQKAYQPTYHYHQGNDKPDIYVSFGQRWRISGLLIDSLFNSPLRPGSLKGKQGRQ